MATKEKKKEELYYFCKKAAAMQEIRACDEVTDSSFLRQPERMSSLDSDDNFSSGWRKVSHHYTHPVDQTTLSHVI